MEYVAVITGANAGIGLATAKRLLAEHQGRQLRVCLACRNMEKAVAVRAELLESFPGSSVDLLHVDTSSPESAINAARELQKRYHHVDWLFCNAGVMFVSGVNWGALYPPTLSNLYYQFTTGGELLRTVDKTTRDGLKEVFSTNVFGHYLMIRHLEDFLSNQGRPCHIVWTSSTTASKSTADPSDLQGEKSKCCYAYSKKIIDCVSMELNARLNDKGIYSDVVCPGLVMSQLTYGILPKWAWSLIYPIILLMRLLLTHTMTTDPSNGAEAMIWLSHQDPTSLDHQTKYYSMVSATGRRYVHRRMITESPELARQVFDQLEHLAQRFTNT